MKYIDADLLRKNIDNWKEAMADAVGEYSDGVRFALEHFTFVLDSLQQEQLPGIEEHGVPGKDFIPVEWVDACEKYGKWKIVQQEQPKPSGYDKALLEVKRMVDKLYDEASIGLNEYDSGLYNGIAETCMKLRGFIKARLDSDGQPEVDLEKEIKEYLEKLGGGHGGFVDNLIDDDLISLSHHFYELGLEARKEVK